MTKQIILILANLLYLLPAFCQELKIEASYWDEDNKLYKLERKYADKNNAVLYIRHTNENSICVKKQELMHRDTLVVQLDYCDMDNKKSKLERFAESDVQTVTSNKTKDSATISFYKNHLLIGDTVLTGAAAINTYEFVNKVKKGRLAMILANEINVKPDALTTDETVRSYYVNNRLVKIEVTNAEQEIVSTSYCNFSGNKLVCKEYQDAQPAKMLNVDSLTWNKDTTEIMWYTVKNEVNKKYVNKYLISKNKLKLYQNDVLQKEVTFVSGERLFQKLLISNLVYNNPQYSCELYQFEIKKIIKITLPNEQERMMEYVYDKQKRVTEQKQFDEFKNVKRIAYTYN